MPRIRPVDLLRWHLCLLLALCCSVYAVWASIAAAFPLDEDLAVARSTLPVRHPCRGRVEVLWVPDLRISGRIVLAGSPTGIHTPEGWMQATVDEHLGPLECVVRVNPDEWPKLTLCGRRRLMIHEVMRLGGHVTSEGGIMATSPTVRSRIAVPRCRTRRISRSIKAW